MADRATEIRRLTIDENVAGVHPLVVVPAGYELVLVSLHLSLDDVQGAFLVTFQDTATLMDCYMITGVPHTLPENNGGWFRGNTAQTLSIVLPGNTAVAGGMTYRLVPTGMEF
jgi:hypothetical protein